MLMNNLQQAVDNRPTEIEILGIRSFMDTENLLNIIRRRRSVRVYKTGKVSDRQLETILEAARWAPSGANTQPWEFVVTRDRKKMKKVRRIYDEEWRQRKR